MFDVPLVQTSLLALLLLVSPSGLSAQQSRMDQGPITSAALATNLFGDSATRTYWVYLPPSYDTSTRRYPVVYALHGWFVNENHMISQLQPTLEAMIRSGTIGEMIVVFPNAQNALLGSYYLSSSVIGDYETYIAKDLVALIDARYRTLPVRESRGLTGLSMGGWGTMHLALKFPDVFSVAVPVAGSYNSRSADRDAKARQVAAYHPTNFEELSNMRRADWHLAVVQAQYAGLLPNPQRPDLYTDYLYEWVNGQAVLSDSADQRCRNGDVQNGDLSRYLLQPVRLRGIKIIHGTADGDTPVADAREFTNALAQAGVPFEYEEHSGAHEYRADLALPFLSAHLQTASDVTNTAPVLTLPANTNIHELVPFTATVSATDSDGSSNQLTFALISGPAGMTIHADTGVIGWTPSEDQGPSTNEIVVRVTDNGSPPLSATNSFTVIVNEVNAAPTLTPPPNAAIDEGVTYSATATATDSDVPANSLTFALVSGPYGLTVSSAGAIIWTPTDAQGPSTNEITLSVTDTNLLAVNATSLSVTGSFQIVVNEVNPTPAFAASHHFTGIAPSPDGTVRLSLDGSVSTLFTNLTGTISNQFRQMFDLYPIEASSNLLDWTPLALLLRTNNDPNPLCFNDTNAAGLDHCFYRTPTNHLLTAFPKPTGPFAVGTVDRVMVDPTRTNLYRYSPPTNAFMVTFWYPAAPAPAGTLPAAMWDQRFAADVSATSAFGFDSRWTWIWPALVGHRFAGAPLARDSGEYPVILYAHGLMGSRKVQSQMAEELASHGFVVIAMDHPDCWGTEFPDGRYLTGNHAGDVAGRLQDVEFLLEEVSLLNSDDPLFAGRLDLDRIGVYGISFGGTVVETCRSDSRVKCAALWDAMNVQLNSAGLQKPFLVALGESNLFLGQDQWLFGKAITNAVFLQVRGAQHLTATDVAWTVQSPSGRNPALAINACMVWFFDTYLKGETPPFPTNPEIYNVQRK